MSEDGGMTLNIVTSGGIGSRKRKKKGGRFYGPNNFRHKRNKNNLKNVNSRPQRIKKISTASVKISSKKGDEEEHLKAVEGSTALHFEGANVIPSEIPATLKKKAVARKSKVKPPSTEKPSLVMSTNASETTPHRAGGAKIPWKSSLFNQNPEIPKIHQPEMTTVKEPMFSAMHFSDLNIHPHLLSYINDKLMLKTMTSIQQKCIPVLLNGKDALVKSQTGSGKTLSYAVPVIQKIQEIQPEITRKDGPVALVLVPTRELALQSFHVFSQLTLPFCRIVPTWIIGGENRKSEKSRIRKGANILVGTPGRILDHIQTTKSLTLSNLRWLIFDEADRLLDMGFQKQVDAILKAVSEQGLRDRQTVLLSATLSEKVERLVDLALKDPVRVLASGENEDSSYESDEREENFALPDSLVQFVAIIPSKLRLVCLISFLRGTYEKNPCCKMIMFLSCRDSVEFHYHLLKHVLRKAQTVPEFSIPLDVDLDESETVTIDLYQLHGGLSQNERQSVFSKFLSATSGILLCTDVAARGLDLPSVDWVVQYTSPGSPVDYIHRVGRTARAGRAGRALLMLTPAEAKYITLLSQFNIQVRETTVENILASAIDPHRGKRDHDARTLKAAKDAATSLQNQMEFHISKNRQMRSLATTAYASFIRAYATYPTKLKSIFHVKYLHLGHVAKSFALQEAPSNIVKTLQKSVGQLPVRTSFEHREAKKEEASKDEEKETKPDEDKNNPGQPPQRQMSRRERIKSKMARKPDMMSEFSSGLGVSARSKKIKLT